MKKRLAAATLAASVIFSLGTTAFADDPVVLTDDVSVEESTKVTAAADMEQIAKEQAFDAENDDMEKDVNTEEADIELLTDNGISLQLMNDGSAVISKYYEKTDDSVYVYAKIAYDDQGWFKKNAQGWVTLGAVRVPGLTKATKDDLYQQYDDRGNTKATILEQLKKDGHYDISMLTDQFDFTSINYVNDTVDQKNIWMKQAAVLFPSISFDVNGYGLKVDDGAIDYVANGTPAWHLDGYIDLRNFALVDVEFYQKQDNDSYGDKVEGQVLRTSDINATDIVVTPSEWASQYEDYALVKAEVVQGSETNPMTSATGDALNTPVNLQAQNNYTVKLYYDPLEKFKVTYKFNYDNSPADVNEKFVAGSKVTVTQPDPERKDYIFTGWKKDNSSKNYRNGDTVVDSASTDITLVAQWTAKQGYFGYFLSSEDATWGTSGAPTGIVSYKDSETGKKKYKEERVVAKGDTTTVTTVTPEWTGQTFLGWGDKLRRASNLADQKAAIRKAGSTLKYYYNNSEAYTLDALWGSLSMEGASKVYDGQPLAVKAASFALNNVTLSDTYENQYKEFLNYDSPIQYSIDGANWVNNPADIELINAGTYTVYAKQKVIVTLTDLTSAAVENETREVVGQATYTITPRDVTLTSGSAKKEYDGKPLTNDTVMAEGFVDGEGATYTVTGTQTEVGSSENKFTYTLNGSTKAGNYNITTKFGTLTVTANTTPDPVNPVDPVDPNPGTTPTPTPVVTPAPTATPAPAPTTAPAAARVATTIPQTGDNFPAVALVIVMLAAIVGLGITVVLRTDKKK